MERVYVECEDGEVVKLPQSRIGGDESESTLSFGGEIIEIEKARKIVVNDEVVSISDNDNIKECTPCGVYFFFKSCNGFIFFSYTKVKIKTQLRQEGNMGGYIIRALNINKEKTENVIDGEMLEAIYRQYYKNVYNFISFVLITILTQMS